MRVRDRSGITLVEVMIAGAISVTIALTAAYFLSTGSQYTEQGRKRIDATDEVMVFEGYAQKNLINSDVRFMAYSGLLAPEHPLERFLIPFAGRCADLSVSGCGQSVALVHAFYDKTRTPALNSPCLISDVASLGLSVGRYGKQALVIDVNSPSYGSVLFNPVRRILSTSIVGGDGSIAQVPLSAGTVLSAQDQAVAYLWVVTAQPIEPVKTQWVAPLPGSNVGVVTIDGGNSLLAKSPPLQPGIQGSCGTLTQIAGPSPVQIVLLPVQPFETTSFTGGTLSQAIASTQQIGSSSIGNFPMKVFPVQIRSLGLTESVGATSGTLAVHSCKLNPLLNYTLDCTGSSVLIAPVHSVQRLRMDLSFYVRTALDPLSRYELLGPGMTQSSVCTPPVCGPLPIAQGLLRTISNPPPETSASLNAGSFTLIKMENIADLKFRIVSAVLNSEVTFDVTPP